MNLQEFAALKVGDEVKSLMAGPAVGTVTAVKENGVTVVWGDRHERETPFFYSVNSTSWMHWTQML